MTTHIILRISHSASAGQIPQFRSYGPCSKDEAYELLSACAVVLRGAGLEINDVLTDRIIAWHKGTSNTFTVIVVPLLPPTDDVCEGI